VAVVVFPLVPVTATIFSDSDGLSKKLQAMYPNASAEFAT